MLNPVLVPAIKLMVITADNIMVGEPATTPSLKHFS
jgi:hypothetical protein